MPDFPGVTLDAALAALAVRVGAAEQRLTVLESTPKPEPDPRPDPEPDPDPGPGPQPDDIHVSELTMSAVQAALAKRSRRGQRIILPPGRGWGASKLRVTGPHAPHIMGAPWQPGSKAYRAPANQDAAEAAGAAFQPRTTDVSFDVECDGATFSRLGIEYMDLLGEDPVVYWCRISGDVMVRDSAYQRTLLTDNVYVGDGAVHPVWSGPGSSSSQKAWNSIPFTPGGDDLVTIQNSLFLHPTGPSVDGSKQGGKFLLRDCTIVGGVGRTAGVRLHGGYNTPSRKWVGSVRYFEIICLRGIGKSVGWALIEVKGGDGIISDVTNESRNNLVHLGLEATIRKNGQNPLCDDLDPGKYPYPQQTTSLYLDKLLHKGRPVTSETDPGFDFNEKCAGKIMRNGRDFHFGLPAGYVPARPHRLMPSEIGG
jgi:hypothetical protein